MKEVFNNKIKLNIIAIIIGSVSIMIFTFFGTIIFKFSYWAIWTYICILNVLVIGTAIKILYLLNKQINILK